MFGFTMILMASWESILRYVGALWGLYWPLGSSTTHAVYCSVSYIGLTNGGTAGMIWMSFICWIGFLFINTSM